MPIPTEKTILGQKYYSITKVSEMLDTDRRTIIGLCNEGKMKAVQLGFTYISESSMLSYLETSAKQLSTL